ncbi:pyrroline-5-carboxylate reductase [Diaphorobacter sp. HDW4A]|uniref:pyrroline-5-carboxylate reductase n=1 Tax=Diaphorobacter sp. HDW4A TaxID=2714924 RepID=UPI00140E05CC|nr:pyrroline-5-carboxylate reductase [Diaphorobacter sp. HDW4A]QIL82057.1 pyrroline-5-carboxylate reductase [Diaphorobacter sp. HDW4A]
MSASTTASVQLPTIAFIGGGNMATAIIGGLIAKGVPATQILVVEPWDEARANLKKHFGIDALPVATDALTQARLVVWAVKPQTFKEAAAATAQFTRQAVHLSIAAGITSDSIAAWLSSDRIVRAMPNTPALVGKGITGLFARAAVTTEEKLLIEQVISSTGQFVWVKAEDHLDAVTAISGSGPAYVFLFLEAMTKAGTDMGLPADQAYQLAVATFQGGSELAARSSETPEVLRQRVTSKGGTTHAAIMLMQEHKVPEHFIAAMRAAEKRAQELAIEFGK